MGIRDRDYWEDATGDWEPEPPDPGKQGMSPRNRRILWVVCILGAIAFVIAAAIGQGRR